MENSKEEKKENMHKHHRANMRQVYYNSGLESLPDHTVLELLLYFGIPMKDTNELAHSLLESFGSFSAVLKAERTDLLSFSGMTENAACLLSLFLPVFQRYSDDLVKKKVVLNDKEAVVEFVRSKFVDAKNERVFAIFTDSADKLISSVKLADGDFSSAVFSIRALVAKCLELNAKNVILVHNHPSGITAPSREDIKLTNRIATVLAELEVSLKEHIILSQNGYTSIAGIGKFSSIFD